MILLNLLLFAASAFAAKPALIFRNGQVFISPGRYASAVAVGGDRILAVGTDAQVLALKGPATRVVDLHGRSLLPGFHDAHVHFLMGAASLDQLDLTGTTSVAQIQKKLAAYAAGRPGNSWILGFGWDHTALPGQRYPTRQELDAVVSDRPVKLEDADTHMSWLNTAALRRIGVDKRTPDPPHGRLPRDASGEPTGILIESAEQLVNAKLPKPDRKELVREANRALELASQFGVTSIQGLIQADARAELETWRTLYRNGKAHLRYFAWARLLQPERGAALRRESADLPKDRFRIVALKVFLDGVIGSRTAALLAPYSDDPATLGTPKIEDAQLRSLVRQAHDDGFQVTFHAIGDRSVRMALDACQASGRKTVSWGGFPPMPACKIEHIEVIDPSDIPRFRALNVVASMQPSHMTYDNESENYNPERLGARVRNAFAWRSFEKGGAVLAFGTDWPVMPIDPRVALFAATTREHFNGKPAGGWIPEQKVSLEDAVVHYTLDSAKAVGMDRELGSIEAGKRADLVVFGQDLFSVSGLALLKVPIVMTVFDGKIVYERPQ